MHAPFENCDPHPESRSKTRALIVDFQREETSQQLQCFHDFAEKLESRMENLCQEAVEEKNAIVYPILRGHYMYPPRMTLKFEPGEVEFVSVTGETLEEATINFQEVDVVPVVWVRDVWKWRNVFYPRLFLLKCTVVPRVNANQ